MHAGRLAVFITILLTPCLGQARQATSTPIGVYSTLHLVEQAGDLLGTEIVVAQSKGAFEVSYQTAEGEPGPVYRVTALVQDDSIFFQLPPDTLRVMHGAKQVGLRLKPHPRFRGRITTEGLRGGFEGGPDDLLPRRAHSYWSHSS